ncbi:hypothetical protein [Selenomonas ruminantium]|uniref:hypothetical protein n=1 Tax=Selenomonas ruminantium TaxID=971 RepID=UPI0005A51864|nr:hypothetical protein [Selenomonas ruminantium]
MAVIYIYTLSLHADSVIIIRFVVEISNKYFPQQSGSLYIICLYNKHIIIYIGKVMVGGFVGRPVSPGISRLELFFLWISCCFVVEDFVGKVFVVGRLVGTIAEAL